MLIKKILLAAGGLIPAIITPALAAAPNTAVQYAPAANWVQPSPAPTQASVPDNAPVRVIYTDAQIHVSGDKTDTYTAYRIRILKPEGLALGNVTLGWNPSNGGVTVHQVRIDRQGQVIDVLKDTKFQVIQREGGLERSMLTGDLTATLQVPGLQVGDEIEIASTSRSHDPTLGDHVFGLYPLPVQGQPGAYRFTLAWPPATHLAWHGSSDLPVAIPATTAHGEQAIGYEIRDPRTVIINDGAPVRYNIRRLVEYSDFSGWPDISRVMWPLFDRAAQLPAGSPLHAEAAKIASASADPAERLRAALRLVEDQVRYVYVGLDGGNYRPASADQTWARRFGDCKAKTVLLLALLRDLSIAAEPVLVNPVADDGTDQRLPNPSVFNHVLVRATIGTTSIWLDGTRSGDVWLDMMPEPSFHWGLPLRKSGAELEKVMLRAFDRPQSIGVFEMDARAGQDQAAKITVQNILRGDVAYATRGGLAALSVDDANQALRNYWTQQENWVVADHVAWSWDERRRTVVLTLSGTGRPDWGNAGTGMHRYTLPGAGFNPPELLHRPAEQDQTAPWLVRFPRFDCYATTVRLPRARPGHHWTLDARPVNRKVGGVAYWRAVGLQAGLARTVMSKSAAMPEISAASANAQNAAIPTFDNLMSSVDEEDGSDNAPSTVVAMPFDDGVNWISDDSACNAPMAPVINH